MNFVSNVGARASGLVRTMFLTFRFTCLARPVPQPELFSRSIVDKSADCLAASLVGQNIL